MWFVIPSDSSYFHRSLNTKKLIDIGFAFVPKRLTYASYIRFLSLPKARTLFRDYE